MVTNVNDLAQLIAADMSKQTSTRQSIGGGGVAFGWASEGMPPTIASYVKSATASGMQVPVTLVGLSATPPAVTGERAQKVRAVDIDGDATLTLAKFAGYAEVTLEQQLSAEGMYPAVHATLAAGCLAAFEAAAVTALGEAAGETATGATWTEALYAGQGIVLANGGSPSLIVASALDYGAIMAAISNSAGYALDPSAPGGVFAGSRVHFSSGLPAGTVYVLDRNAVLAVEHESSPVVAVSSAGTTNVTTVVADLIAGLIVTSPAHVVQVTKTV